MSCNQIDSDKFTWEWSLKPLRICMGFAGIKPISGNNSATACFLILSIGAVIFLSNAVMNGPRFLDLVNFDFISDSGCDVSPWLCTNKNPVLLLTFTYKIAGILLYLTFSLTHFVCLIITSISPKWEDLWNIMKKIHLDMRLNERFKNKCRKKCLVAILLSLMVCIFYIIPYRYGNQKLFFNDFHYNNY